MNSSRAPPSRPPETNQRKRWTDALKKAGIQIGKSSGTVCRRAPGRKWLLIRRREEEGLEEERRGEGARKESKVANQDGGKEKVEDEEGEGRRKEKETKMKRRRRKKKR